MNIKFVKLRGGIYFGVWLFSFTDILLHVVPIANCTFAAKAAISKVEHRL